MKPSANSTSDKRVLVTGGEKNCVECESRHLSCPPCEVGFICHLTVRTCSLCPTMTCIGTQAATPKAKGSIVPMAIGITAATVAVVVFILGMLARRKYKQDRSTYGTRISSVVPLSPCRASRLTEKHTTLNSRGSKNGILDRIRPSRQALSATFSDLNFNCDEDIENDFEPSITRPKQVASPTHFKDPNNRPPENLNGFISPSLPIKERPPSEDWMRMGFPAMGEGLDMRQIDAQASRERTLQSSSHLLGLDIGMDADFHLSIQFPSIQK